MYLKPKKAFGNFIEIVSLLKNFCWPHVSACAMLSHYQRAAMWRKKYKKRALRDSKHTLSESSSWMTIHGTTRTGLATPTGQCTKK